MGLQGDILPKQVTLISFASTAPSDITVRPTLNPVFSPSAPGIPAWC